mmetsp:Transcript_80910/g.143307  ORF Transcript_80910/g.143307 Transcript_80910/m.143307 type:complete len:107 (-) Transcript_80910:46-366(-)
MAPMKGMKGKPVVSISKSGIAEKIMEAVEMKKSDALKVLDALAEIGTAEVKKGKFTIPGLVMIKTKLKPATKAGKKVMFGKEVKVKAKKAKTVVKAFPVAALKAAI